MPIQHISAFSDGSTGGNPAGVVLCDSMPGTDVMQTLAAEIGYSETVFAAPDQSGWRVRYFSPEVEVDFCGHATIALGAVLAKTEGPGTFSLTLNRADITVEGRYSEQEWGASFQSPPTHSRAIDSDLLVEALALFGLDFDDLDTRIPPAIAHGGGDHLILALKERKTLQTMQYDQREGRDLAVREGLVTFSLIYAEQDRLFHSRNPFPVGGVFEDPATGAAAAALAGYLRDIDWPHKGSIVIIQGEDMGMPSRLEADIAPQIGSSIRVSGMVRLIR
ncbi:PhzF family phenazine biosynthesis protein [Photobacterium sp. Hal280]|uniref:PhzF family phenazine biosynthesis protein n=1 Tax=Photobacterium sp. Hal280 TaxID=3035163 RepID=UPI00301C8D2C